MHSMVSSLMYRLDYLPILVSRLALPTCREQRRHLEPREGMGLGINDNAVQRQQVIGREEEVEILQSLRL